MHLKRIATLILCSTSAACTAQAPPAATAQHSAVSPAAGPSMQETVAFMNEMDQKYGRFLEQYYGNPATESKGQPVILERPCTLSFPSESSTTVLDLARTDAMSMSIGPQKDYAPPVYLVQIGNAALSWESLGSLSPANRKQVVPAIGNITAQMNERSSTMTEGVIASISADSFTYFIGNDQFAVVPRKSIATLWFFPPLHDRDTRRSELVKTTFKGLGVGDLVSVSQFMGGKPGEEPRWDVEFYHKQYAGRFFSPARFTEKSAAERYAKAMIHAISLCSSATPTSPF